jgi:hypothetical protein
MNCTLTFAIFEQHNGNFKLTGMRAIASRRKISTTNPKRAIEE